MFARAIGPGSRFLGTVVAALFVGAVLALAAVPTAADEAKPASAVGESVSFTPPPRTITDITAILDEQKLADPKATADSQAEAAKVPPAGAEIYDLIMFFWDRGLAAGRIGNTKQQRADLKEAVRVAEAAGRLPSELLLWDLSIAESLAGNFANVVRYQKRSLDLVPPNKGGKLIMKPAVLAMSYADIGDLDAAADMLDQAYSVYAEAAGWQVWSLWNESWNTRLQRAEGYILDARGRYREAEEKYRTALRDIEIAIRKQPYRGQYDFVTRTDVRSKLASNLLHQGRLVEAEVIARNSLIEVLGRVGRYSQHTAQPLRSLASAIRAQGRYREAEKLARVLVDLYRQIGASDDSLQLAFAHQLLADTLLDQGRWEEALSQFEAIRKGLATDRETFEKIFARDLGWAVALLMTGRPAGEPRAIAEKALRKELQNAGPDHVRTATARGVLAMAFARSGDKNAALREFTKAMPVLLSRPKQSEEESVGRTARAQRLRTIFEAYVDLLAGIRETALARELGIDPSAEAFRIAGVARGQSVQRALAASAARAAAKNPALADLVRREQDALKQINALHGLLANSLSVPTDQQNADALKSLRQRIADLRKAQVEMAGEIEKRFPDYTNLINPKPATTADAKKVLRADEALISTYVGEKKTYVWAIPKEGPVAFAVADIGLEDLTDTVDSLRADLEPNARTLGDIPPFDLETAHRLYTDLLRPVQAGWKEAKSLLVVPHGPLGYLPLSLLPTEPSKLGPAKKPFFSNYRTVPWLARTHAVTSLPSVASLRTLRSLPPGNAKRRAFAGFGDPWFNETQAQDATRPKRQAVALAGQGVIAVRGQPMRLRAVPKTTEMDSADLSLLPRLPETADEVRSIGLAMNAELTKSVFLGKDASEGRVKAMDLSGVRVLAFATHGLVPGDLDGLTQPALALTSPKVGGGKDDGLLTMGEILALKLDADWVVLSACNTGSGEGAGAEAVSGLGRAFFYAGTRALLVSNWPVETTSARTLTTDLFRRQADDPNLTRAEALRQAMVGLIDGPGKVDPKSKEIVYSYAHPLFWAPFTLVGDGGGAAN